MAAAERLSGSANISAQQTARPPEAPGGAPPAPAIPTLRSSQVSSKSEGNLNGKVLSISYYGESSFMSVVCIVDLMVL